MAKKTGTKKTGTKRPGPKTSGRKKTGSTTRRSSARASAPASRTRSGGRLSSASIDDLQREIARRQRAGHALLRRRDKLAAQLSEVEQEIARIGLLDGASRVGAGPRKRPRNSRNLVDALAEVLKGRTMGVSEAAEAVQTAGYRTSSPNFRTIVNQQLLANKKVFRKVERGKYTAR